MESFTKNVLADHSAIISMLMSPLNIYRNGESVWGTETYRKAIEDINVSIRRIKTRDKSVIISADLSDEMMEMIVESLKANGKDLEKIERILVLFRVSDVTELIEALAKNTTVHTLAIADKSLSEQGMVALAETMMKNKTIRSLDIGRHNLRVESSKALAKALAKNASILSLHIDVSREMVKDGAAALAKALVTNVTLRTGKVFFSRYRKFMIGEDKEDKDNESESDSEDEDEDM
jgi:hypothetical protein